MDEEGFKWKRQQSWFHEAERHAPEFMEKRGPIIQAYVAPAPGVRVICVDEMWLIAVKTYPGEEWKTGTNRATFEPDHGRRGQWWVHAAFEPATGQARFVLSPSRDSAAHIQLLEKVISESPAER
jgi:hypothetical protein